MGQAFGLGQQEERAERRYLSRFALSAARSFSFASKIIAAVPFLHIHTYTPE
jgi:hypothetical protein